MSIAVPLAAEMVRRVGWQLLLSITWPGWMQSDPNCRRPVGGVLPGELSKHVYKRGDRALLDIVAEHRKREMKSLTEKISAGQMVFAVLALGFLDYFPDFLGIPAETLLREVPRTFGTVGELAIEGALLLALAAIKVTWFSVDELPWIDYPPLYDEIEKARIERGHLK